MSPIIPVLLACGLGLIAWVNLIGFWLLGYLLLGLIVGALARLVLPGRSEIGWLATALYGAVGAVLAIVALILRVAMIESDVLRTAQAEGEVGPEAEVIGEQRGT